MAVSNTDGHSGVKIDEKRVALQKLSTSGGVVQNLHLLTLALPFRIPVPFGEKLLTNFVVCPHTGTAVLKGF